MSSSSALRIVHVFRAPLGGLFRHVIDLAVEQAARGHAVGLFFDRGGDCARVREAIARIPGGTALGVEMTPIRRNPDLTDITAMRAFARYLKRHAARRRARTRLEGRASTRGSSAAANRRRPADPRLHAARRQLQLSAGQPRCTRPTCGSSARSPGAPICSCSRAITSARGTTSSSACDHGVRRVIVNGLGAAEFAPVEAARGGRRLPLCRRVARRQGDRHAARRVGAGRAGKPGSAPSAVLVGSGPRPRRAHRSRGQARAQPRRCDFPGPLPVRAGVRARPHHGRALARRIHALCGARGGGGGGAADRHRCRRHPRDFRTLPRPARAARRSRRSRAADDRGIAAPAAPNARAAPPSSPSSSRPDSRSSNMADTVISAYREALARRDLDARTSRRGVAGGAHLVNEA